jgi:hypothetical protein
MVERRHHLLDHEPPSLNALFRDVYLVALGFGRFVNTKVPARGPRPGTAEGAIIEGNGGHLDGVLNVAKQGEAIRAFLSK